MKGELPYVSSFGEVATGAPLLHSNSLLNVSFSTEHGRLRQAAWDRPRWRLECAGRRSCVGSGQMNRLILAGGCAIAWALGVTAVAGHAGTGGLHPHAGAGRLWNRRTDVHRR